MTPAQERDWADTVSGAVEALMEAPYPWTGDAESLARHVLDAMLANLGRTLAEQGKGETNPRDVELSDWTTADVFDHLLGPVRHPKAVAIVARADLDPGAPATLAMVLAVAVGRAVERLTAPGTAGLSLLDLAKTGGFEAVDGRRMDPTDPRDADALHTALTHAAVHGPQRLIDDLRAARREREHAAQRPC